MYKCDRVQTSLSGMLIIVTYSIFPLLLFGHSSHHQNNDNDNDNNNYNNNNDNNNNNNRNDIMVIVIIVMRIIMVLMRQLKTEIKNSDTTEDQE